MKMPMKAEDPLLDNHFEFLRTHRGAVIRDGAHAWVESSRPEFTYLVHGAGDAPAAWLARARAIHCLPGATRTDDALRAHGLAPAGGFTYMTLGAGAPTWRGMSGLDVRTATSADEIETFSDVQTRGFLEDGDDYAVWRAFLGDANTRNRQNPGQRFYVGFLDGAPVGVVLTVRTGATVGIYAVATLSEQRKRGVSTTLLQRAVADARSDGADEITLQVVSGSYAESLYAKLGFRPSFATRIFRAPN